MQQEIYVCSECGSEDVEMKQWVKPNKNNELSGNDCPEAEDCWCNNCQGNHSLELKKQKRKRKQ